MRQDDHESKCYFRSSDRVFRLNGAWYFTTREGDEGPFPNEQIAHAEVERFITARTELAKFQADRALKQDSKSKDAGIKLELVALDDRPRIRATESVPANQRVYV